MRFVKIVQICNDIVSLLSIRMPQSRITGTWGRYLQMTRRHIIQSVLTVYLLLTASSHIYFNICAALRHGTHYRGISQFYLHTHAFIHEWNKPYLPLPFQPKLVLIYLPRRDERLSWLRHYHGK